VLLHVPVGVEVGSPPVLVVTLHGAGGSASNGLAPLLPLADAGRLLLLAPTAHDKTWDAVLGRWGADVDRIDRALEQVFASCPVDPSRLAVSGFSDGASYALSLGLANGDLFSHIVAFSPGFIPAGPRVGIPAVYIAHGRGDEVLPIELTTRRIVPRLRATGLPTELREFDGTHTVHPEIATEAVDWLRR
jgi:predicted esterase